MQEVTGLITKINKKTKTNAGAFMKSPAYSMMLDDSTWYNMGFDAPTFNEGDVVTFPYTESQYGREGKTNAVRVQAGGADAGAQTASPAVQKATQSADARQESIVFQSSLKVATDIIGLALIHDCLALPSKKADRLPMVVSMIREVARDIALEAIKPDFASFAEDTAEVITDE